MLVPEPLESGHLLVWTCTKGAAQIEEDGELFHNEASFRRLDVAHNDDLLPPWMRQILANHLNDFKRHLQGVQFVLG
jgi:hypothetical protein